MQTQLKYVPFTHLHSLDHRQVEEDQVQVAVQLVPLISQAPDGQITIRSFTREDRAIDVVFVGACAELAMPIVSKLRAKLAKARSVHGADADIDSLRQHALLEGRWHRRFRRDAEGWQTHTHQFQVSRFSVLDARGMASNHD